MLYEVITSAAKSDPKERARQAALTRKMSPEEKAEYKQRKAREQLVARMGVDPRITSYNVCYTKLLRALSATNSWLTSRPWRLRAMARQ